MLNWQLEEPVVVIPPTLKAAKPVGAATVNIKSSVDQILAIK